MLTALTPDLYLNVFREVRDLAEKGPLEDEAVDRLRAHYATDYSDQYADPADR